MAKKKNPNPGREHHIYDTVPYPTFYIKYKGVWDMDDLFNSTADWFRERKYKFYEKGTKTTGIFEGDKRVAKDLIFEFRGERNDEDYFHTEITLMFQVWGAKDFKVTLSDGTKKNLMKGRMWIHMCGMVTVGWDKWWNDNLFFNELRSFYNKFLIRKKWHARWEDEIFNREMQQLHNHIKERLRMESEGYEHQYWLGVKS